jgi:hypothetical protein
MITHETLTLREKILNIVKSTNIDPKVEHYIRSTDFVAFTALPEDKDKLIKFADTMEREVFTLGGLFSYVTVSRSVLDSKMIADPRGLLLNVHHYVRGTHKMGNYEFVKLGNFKTVNLQKIAITL